MTNPHHGSVIPDPDSRSRVNFFNVKFKFYFFLTSVEVCALMSAFWLDIIVIINTIVSDEKCGVFGVF